MAQDIKKYSIEIKDAIYIGIILCSVAGSWFVQNYRINDLEKRVTKFEQYNIELINYKLNQVIEKLNDMGNTLKNMVYYKTDESKDKKDDD